MENLPLKVFYLGGVKSGKSLLAEEKAISLNTSGKPIYLATNELKDEGMLKRIAKHRMQRQDRFITIEEGIYLYDAIKEYDQAVLVECITMWINNMLYHKLDFAMMSKIIQQLLSLKQSVVFVQNEVGLGVMPENEIAREFIDLSGHISQILANQCDEVYFCQAGLSLQMK